MKHITYEQYCRMREALCDFADKQPDPYRYLFELINGFPSGARRDQGVHKKLLSLARIKEIWDSPGEYKTLAELAIMCHYKGHALSTSPSVSQIVSQDAITMRAGHIVRQHKQQSDKPSMP